MEHISELRLIVSTAMNGLIAQAIDKKSFFINDVPAGIIVLADHHMLQMGLTEVLLKALKHTENDCIRISAKTYNNIILLTIKETNQRPHTTIAFSMEQLQPIAEKLGGSISVNSDDDDCVTVAFSFFNGTRAA